MANDAAVIRLLEGPVLVFTGAGVSVPSGVPAFRGAGGLYEGRDAYDLASSQGFARDPALVWNWYLHRIRGLQGVRPNAAHLALAELARRNPALTVVTSNVDPLHEMAGQPRLYKLHGDILRTRCLDCGSAAPLDLAAAPARCAPGLTLACPCGGRLRPDVVWFGETPRAEAVEAVLRELPRAGLVVEVGVSGYVSYGFAEGAARLGIPLAIVNPQPEWAPNGAIVFAEPCEEVLPRWLAAMGAGR
jgi:NAD-dependent deacetylase